ncbi:peptidylprolyl isomerase [Pseudomonas putida]
MNIAHIHEQAPALIATSELQWPRITVNGVCLAGEAIARELQYHPAPSREEVIFLACQALVVRELLRQRIAELGLQAECTESESEEEALTRVLIEQELALPGADDDICRHYFERNRERYATAPLLAARHILLPCAAEDAEARSQARELCAALVAQLAQDASCFAELAQIHSACPSKEQGGALGQVSQGQTVPEFERQLLRLPTGLAMQPLESRYGVHLVWVDQRIEGRALPFEVVHEAIRAELDQRAWQVAVAHYLATLIAQADIRGIDLDSA